MSFFAPKLPQTTVAPAPNNPEAKADAKPLADPTEQRSLTRAKAAGRDSLKVDLNSGQTFAGGGSGGAGINLPRV